VDVAELIPQPGEKSARYTGSLTTPREVQALNGRTIATHDRHFERDEGVGN